MAAAEKTPSHGTVAVSLLPCATDCVAALGLENLLAGRTHEVRPSSAECLCSGFQRPATGLRLSYIALKGTAASLVISTMSSIAFHSMSI